MHDSIERVLLTEEQIRNRIKEVGQQLAEEYDGKCPIFVGILKGVVVFFSDMVRAIPIDCQFDFMCVSSYDGTETTGVIKVKKDLSADITGRHVVILEDIIDSGLTLKHTVDYLKSKNPASLKICTFLDKPERRIASLEADYVCFTIPNEFEVGYGLDFDESYRNLPYVGILKPEAYTK